MPTKTEGQIVYEAEIAKQAVGVGAPHRPTWPTWEKLSDETRARWNNAEWRAHALKGA